MFGQTPSVPGPFRAEASPGALGGPAGLGPQEQSAVFRRSHRAAAASACTAGAPLGDLPNVSASAWSVARPRSVVSLRGWRLRQLAVTGFALRPRRQLGNPPLLLTGWAAASWTTGSWRS